MCCVSAPVSRHCCGASACLTHGVALSLRSAQAALKQAKRKDYYKILEIPRDADEGAIKRAYYKAAKKWHPDRHASAEEHERKAAEQVFKDVSEAYEVLSDATKRRRYDMGADVQEIDQEDAAGASGFHGFHGGGGFGGFGGGMPDIFQVHLTLLLCCLLFPTKWCFGGCADVWWHGWWHGRPAFLPWVSHEWSFLFLSRCALGGGSNAR
jgi:DnaJ-domain-containing protein 1